MSVRSVRASSVPKLLILGTLPALVLSALTACEPADASPGFVLTDSAGVWIAESDRPAWGEGEGWRLSPEPLLEIGVLDGPAEYRFSEVLTARRLRDGRIAVGDRIAPDGAVRFFGADGRFLAGIAPVGGGPGEVESLRMLARYRGDSLAVWDGLPGRLSVFDDQGRLGRTVRIALPPPEGPRPGEAGMVAMIPGSLQGVFDDGSLFVRGTTLVQGELGEVVRVDLPLFRYGPDGEVLDTLGTFPGPDIRLPSPQGPALGVPFPRQFAAAIHGNRLYVGTGDAYEIRVLDADGAPAGLIRAFHRDLALSSEAREAFREAEREGASDVEALREVERALAGVRFPETLPPYDQLRVDAEGYLWVRDAELPGETEPRRWSVFDPDGRLLGTVETPARFSVHEIGPDYVLGVRTDDLDVPYVLMYALDRG